MLAELGGRDRLVMAGLVILGLPPSWPRSLEIGGQDGGLAAFRRVPLEIQLRALALCGSPFAPPRSHRCPADCSHLGARSARPGGALLGTQHESLARRRRTRSGQGILSGGRGNTPCLDRVRLLLDTARRDRPLAAHRLLSGAANRALLGDRQSWPLLDLSLIHISEPTRPY